MQKERKSRCECGKELNYITTPHMTAEKRICPKCGRLHYVDGSPIDWAAVNDSYESVNDYAIDRALEEAEQ